MRRIIDTIDRYTLWAFNPQPPLGYCGRTVR